MLATSMEGSRLCAKCKEADVGLGDTGDRKTSSDSCRINVGGAGADEGILGVLLIDEDVGAVIEVAGVSY